MSRNSIHPDATKGRKRLVLVAFAAICGWVSTGISSQAASLKPSEIKEEYRQILETLATGNLDQALAELLEFETSVVGDEQPWLRMESFWRLKLRTLRDLLNADTLDLLKPVIGLHSEAYFAYNEAGRRFMAGHSRIMASELAEIYGLRADSPEARVFSGRVLTNFGVALWTPTNIVQSSDLFLRATAIDSGNLVALLGLGTAYEHAGNYDRAIRYLSAVLGHDSSNHLASLRLAMCQLRASEDLQQEAVQRLENLSQSEADVWIRSVAYQELVRLKINAEDLEWAEALLHSALEQIPDDQALRVQLAMVLDLQRRPNEAIEVLDGIPADGWAIESPRHRYSIWEPVGVDERRAWLREEMMSGLEVLQGALAESSEDKDTAP
ncbi:MAG: hypothetical protein P8Y44_04945 [Acidobacteriota bacterium]